MELIEAEGMLVGGERSGAAAGATYEVHNPANGEVIATVAEGGPEDIDRAVEAARAALPAWRAVRPRDRARLLRRFAATVEDHAEELARLESRNAGKPIRDTLDEGAAVAEVIHYYAGAIDKHFGETIPTQAAGQLMTFREPLGVVGIITPWNFPMAISNWKVAPALAAGNTIVLKPASLTPLSSLRLAELALEAGIPEGVLNVVPGPGSTAGIRLAAHRDVRKVAFTGSTAVGIEVSRVAAPTMKRVSLELGGKSANIVHADADVDLAAETSPMMVFANAGQDCCARSRVLVHESVAERFVELFIDRTARLRVGDPLDPATEVGPLISPGQRQTALDYIALGREEGARLLRGGDVPDDEARSAGNFLLPAVLDGVDNGMRVAREEIFGPVVSLLTFREEAEAIAIANDSDYGLSGSVWSRDGARALRTARAMETGNISVNASTSVHLEAPFGGFKSSGIGRELGMHALDLYTEVKTMFVAIGEAA
ncbi:MAG: aldehyde dehydrogenase [Solirubrobacterales bacterium]